MAGGVEEEEVVVMESREWFLSSYAPKGVPTSEHLKLRTVTVSLGIDSIPDNHVAVQVLLISVDPYLRTTMTGIEDGLYVSQFAVNEVITAYGIGRVIRSKDSNFKKGDIFVDPFLPVGEYSVRTTQFMRKIDPTAGISLPDYLSCLGVPGFAAWVGIEVIAKPKAGSNVFISAAAGGVGMFAGQLAKIRGCTVIGSTGSDEKVKLSKEEFGYDDVFNYNTETDLDAALTRFLPNGIDTYLDNVGGKMLEAVLNHVNKGACVPVCGMISQYNKVWEEREGIRNMLNIVGKEVRIQGFMIGSFLDRFQEFAMEMETHLKQGKITTKNKIYNGIPTFLDSLSSLFSGSNAGKVVLQVSP